jgi:hypothetical protein
MSDLNEKNEMTKEEFAANEIRAFCAYVMHPDSDLHKDADDWIKERLQANGADSKPANCAIFDVVRSLRFDKPTETGWQFDPDLLRSITKAAMKHDPLISMEHVEYVLRAIADKQ